MTYEPAAAQFGDSYSVSVSVTDEREINRLWGIPLVGMAARSFMAIPHFAVLSIMSIGISLWACLGWIPILAYGRVPGLAVTFLSEYLHRSARTSAYVAFLMPGGYPPLEPGMPIPVDVRLHLKTLQINRLWGIPILGLFVRFIVLLPHIIIGIFLAVAVILGMLVLWIPILTSGRYPEWAARLYRLTLTYTARIWAYLFFLPVPYPPVWPR
jgi:hypothetical protein